MKVCRWCCSKYASISLLSSCSSPMFVEVERSFTDCCGKFAAIRDSDSLSLSTADEQTSKKTRCMYGLPFLSSKKTKTKRKKIRSKKKHGAPIPPHCSSLRTPVSKPRTRRSRNTITVPSEGRMRGVPALTQRSLRAAFRARASTSSSLYAAGGTTRTALVRRKATAAAPAGRPLRVCVVGSGPAGFYVTKYLLKVSDKARRKSKHKCCHVCNTYVCICMYVWKTL